MIQHRNSIMRGASGALGKELVFRQRGGKTIISLPPVFRHHQPTAAQQARRERFKEAVHYAKRVLADPVLRAAYEARLEPGKTVYNTAIKEYIRGLNRELIIMQP